MPRQIPKPPSSRLLRAAQYLRMSTEHQQYSIAIQFAAIALYAAAHNIGIIRSFADEGRSGTMIKGRRGLQELLRVVESGGADFELVLVYDVSRWGRFADVDEAAHYEYLCKHAGIGIRYCAEQFENDNSPTSNLLKAVRRAMAGEYSRELSVKVLAGQCRLAQKGFRLGGSAAYGLQRLLLDKEGKVKQVLGPGERKSLQTDRIVLIPGDQQEVRTIRRIFHLFTTKKKTSGEIVKTLNGDGLSFHGHPWTTTCMDYVLENPAYMGTNAFCRWKSLGSRLRTLNPKDKWITRERAFQAIVEPSQFQAAQEIIAIRRYRFSKQGMLDALRRLWKEKGTLSTYLVDAAPGVPAVATFLYRFGGMTQAYRLIGFRPERDYSYAKVRFNFTAMRKKIYRDIALQIQAAGGSVRQGVHSIFINDGITARVMFCRPRVWPGGRTVWPLLLRQKRLVDVLIAVRLEPEPPFDIVDYYVIPKNGELRGGFHIRKRNNPAFIDLYRMDTLKPFIEAFRRSPIPVAA
jgi:DNA invertase Pin-like site-specific DNA recombinase